MAYDIRPLALAEILDRGFRILRDHFVLLVGIAAWVWLPYGVLLALAGHNRTVSALAMLAFLAVSPLMYAAQIVAIADVYLDRPATIGGSYGAMRAIILPIIGTSLMLYFFVLLGFIALLIPGIYLVIRWSLVPPIMIVERRFGMAALRRSGELVRGAWGRTLAVLLVATLIATVPGSVLQICWAMIPFFGQILNAATSAVLGSYSAIVLVLYYFDRRCRVEEFDLHLLASQIRAEGEGGAGAAVAGTSSIA